MRDLDDESPDDSEVPEGAAVFPEIPEDLGVDPLFLATIHALVFLAGSDEAIVHPDAGEEILQQMATYLQRLEGPALERVKQDMDCLVGFARQQKWQKGLVQSLRGFLADLGVVLDEEA